MTPPGPGSGPADESYPGPPPTLRPDPVQLPIARWRQAGLADPPPAVWPPPPGTPPHDEPCPYLLAMRARDWAWWRPLVGLGLLGVAAVVVGSLVGVLGILTGVRPDLSLFDATDPAVLLLTNASLLVVIPVVWLSWVVAHRMGPGWSSSVLARFRRRLLLRCLALALLSVGIAAGAAVLLRITAGGAAVDGPVRSWGWLLAVVLLTTPLQAAAEEYLFRGYLSQSIAGWIGRRTAGAVVAAVVTATLFSLAHLPPDLPAFLTRLALGLAASAVVVLTGGLEAAVALHVVIAVLALLLGGFLGAGPTTGAVPAGAIGIGVAGYVALVAVWARRAHPETATPATDLRPPVRPDPVAAG
jgi:membrane protease YdiL (CAAX protease family)